MQNGYLRSYLAVTVGVLLLVTLPRLPHALAAGAWTAEAPSATEVGLAGLTLAGAVFACVVRSPLAAVAGLGVTGIGVAILFALFSAPDLATTQILVEALGVILLVLLFRRLPGPLPRDRAVGRAGRLALALGAGAVLRRSPTWRRASRSTRRPPASTPSRAA